MFFSIFSIKLEAFMKVAKYGSISQAAREMNRTTPPVAKGVKDFECSMGKKLFIREKFGMRLTNEGTILYNDLKGLYQEAKEITKKYATDNFTNTVNIYYDWGKSKILSAIFKEAKRNNIEPNILGMNVENATDLPDYDGNIFIIKSEKIICDKFSLIREVQGFAIGVYAKKDIINKSKDVMSLLHDNIWLCNPILYKSKFIKSLKEQVPNHVSKNKITQVDNTACCSEFMHEGNYIFITNSTIDDFDRDATLTFVPFTKEIFSENNLYFYQSKSPSSALNKLIDYVKNVNL
ncbi:LysR family transcriptional regulator [Candidatus Fukatsuia symbiotica]|nr:LysR family transcriptional regulator [Candidatus Fukatsuia symbiotica]MEA9444240.1 LysR family transcriptional regulator [Candidatus Fukatsuia symbiotica]